MTDHAAIDAAIASLGLTIDAQFVQFSKSRNRDEKRPSLNWRVTLKRNGRDVLTTDYSAGCGHTESYKASVKKLGSRNCIMRDDAIRAECETGIGYASRKHVALEPRDVLYSLVMDADVIDAGTFEEWASNYGYDTDSRKAESIYRACLEHALKLRAAIGDAGLSQLRDIFQNY